MMDKFALFIIFSLWIFQFIPVICCIACIMRNSKKGLCWWYHCFSNLISGTFYWIFLRLTLVIFSLLVCDSSNKIFKCSYNFSSISIKSNCLLLLLTCLFNLQDLNYSFKNLRFAIRLIAQFCEIKYHVFNILMYINETVMANNSTTINIRNSHLSH